MALLRRFIPSEFCGPALPDRNPSRGWYQVFSFDAAAPPDETAAASSLCRDDRLALVLFDLGAFKGKVLDDGALRNIEQGLAFFKKHGVEMIVRPVYDRQGKGMENEPLSLSLVKEHIRQVGAVLAGYSQHIHVVQGVFVGNWGEMHGSKFLSDGPLKELAETLYTALEGTCFVNVRTPAQQRLLGGKAGLFNDGLFGSESHLGTFAAQGDMQYAELCCRGVPNGGEAVFGGDFTPQQTIDVLQKLHITYLNRVYDSRILDLWKQTPLSGSESLYSYIGSRLGYRLELKNVKTKISGASIEIRLTIANSGFGCLTKKATLRFYAEEEGKAPVMKELSDALPESGQTKSFACAFSGRFGRTALFLELVHENGESIRPINCPAEKRICLGSIVTG